LREREKGTRNFKRAFQQWEVMISYFE